MKVIDKDIVKLTDAIMMTQHQAQNLPGLVNTFYGSIKKLS